VLILGGVAFFLYRRRKKSEIQPAALTPAPAVIMLHTTHPSAMSVEGKPDVSAQAVHLVYTSELAAATATCTSPPSKPKSQSTATSERDSVVRHKCINCSAPALSESDRRCAQCGGHMIVA
jgi:hypothetical protein